MNLIQISEPNSKCEPQIAVGIDLGTKNSAVAVIDNQIPKIVGNIIPSIAEFKGISVSSIKRLMGKSLSEVKRFQIFSQYDFVQTKDNSILLKLGKKELSPEEISAEILKILKTKAEQELNCNISKAVITVPAYFDDGARNATKNAAKLAGIEVLRLINEPTSAALSYGIDNQKEGKYIVYDLGGGTFDLSMLNMHEGIFQVIATSGDINFGGDDLDEKLLDYLLKKLNKTLKPESIKMMLAESKLIKERLSKENMVTANLAGSKIEISQQEYSALIAKDIDYTIQLIEKLVLDSKVKLSEIDGIIMVGGSTKNPLIKEKIYNKFKIKILDDLDPDTVVAKGAAIQANQILNSTNSHLLLDVVPLSLGIEVMGGMFERIIYKNSPIPAIVEREFTTYEDGQTGIVIHILQGEREFVKDCRSLARITLKNIPPLKAGYPRLVLKFAIDADGILTVTAYEKSSNIIQRVEIKPSHGMNLAKIEKILSNAYKNAQKDLAKRKEAEQKLEEKYLI